MPKRPARNFRRNQSSLQPFAIAAWAACAAQQKLARDIQILAFDSAGGSAVPASYFVLCSVDSSAQHRAVTRAISGLMQQWHGLMPENSDQDASARWTVLDYGSVLIHVMRGSDRAYYDLEAVWADNASRVPAAFWETLEPPQSDDSVRIAS
ncbi:MAG: ribosome silencing factor [Vampirovibrionales bacterium]|nr:ribosome silencing factor [Vampirovibrionales bacterium]